MTHGPSSLDRRSIDLRRKIVESLAAGNRGHLGSALSLVEILRVLYDDILRYDPNNPAWNALWFARSQLIAAQRNDSSPR